MCGNAAVLAQHVKGALAGLDEPFDPVAVELRQLDLGKYRVSRNLKQFLAATGEVVVDGHMGNAESMAQRPHREFAQSMLGDIAEQLLRECGTCEAADV